MLLLAELNAQSTALLGVCHTMHLLYIFFGFFTSPSMEVCRTAPLRRAIIRSHLTGRMVNIQVLQDSQTQRSEICYGHLSRPSYSRA